LTELRISLAAGAWTAEVSPAIGGAILSLAHDGVAVLRPTPEAAVAARDVHRAACYPLLPYANRIAYGRFSFGGVAYQLAMNSPGSPHPMHGVGMRRPWRVLSADARACEIALEHRTIGADAADWPFAFDARQRFELGGGGLAVTVSITNADDREAPAGFGLHSYFPRRPGERLTFAAAGAWTNGADMLPDRREGGPEWDFSSGRPVEGPPLDNDVFGWDGRARLSAPGRPDTVVEAGPKVRSLRVYTPAGRDDYAVEPVTHRADAINHPDEPDGAMAVLAPGETLAGAVRYGLDLRR
jgi:aldose 1-epimerase